MLERFLGVFWALGERRPVLLVVEDLHRADAATRALVTFISRISRPGRLAVVGTYQPDEMTRAHPLHADLTAMSDTPRAAGRIELALRPARAPSSSRRSTATARRPRCSSVAERSRGIPGRRGGARGPARRGGAQAGGLEESVLARVRRRSPECRRVLRLLSVADGPLTRAELAAVAAASEAGSERRPPRSSSTPRRADPDLDADLRTGLAEALEHAWVVVGTAADGAETVAFRHELIGRAVAADLLPLQHRRHLAAVATALAERPAAAAGYWLLAHDVVRARRAVALDALQDMETPDAARDTPTCSRRRSSSPIRRARRPGLQPGGVRRDRGCRRGGGLPPARGAPGTWAAEAAFAAGMRRPARPL
jgi:hypothetical protein